MNRIHRYVFSLLVFFTFFPWQPATAAPLSLSLENCIVMALTNNPAIKISATGKEKASWAVKQAEAGKGLTIEFTHTTLRSDMPKSFMPTLAPISAYNYFKNQLSASVPIYSGGKLESDITQASLNQKFSKLQLEVTKQQLTLDTTTTYYQVLQNRNLAEVAARSVDDFTAHLQNVQKQYDAGTVALPDVLQTKVRLANAQNGLIKASNSYAQAIYQLNTLIGLPIHIEIEINDRLVYQQYTHPLDDCIGYALNHRPDMIQAQTLVSLANEQVTAAKSSKSPTVNVNITNAWDDTNFMGTKNSKWAASLTANWNVFDSGLTDAQLKQATCNVTSTTEQARQTRDTITLEVSNAYLNMREAEKRMETNTVAVEQAEVDFRLAKERYENGLGTNLDVIDAELALTQAKTNYVQALYDYHIGKAQLDKAMGMTVQ